MIPEHDLVPGSLHNQYGVIGKVEQLGLLLKLGRTSGQRALRFTTLGHVAHDGNDPLTGGPGHRTQADLDGYFRPVFPSAVELQTGAHRPSSRMRYVLVSVSNV